MLINEIEQIYRDNDKRDVLNAPDPVPQLPGEDGDAAGPST